MRFDKSNLDQLVSNYTRYSLKLKFASLK